VTASPASAGGGVLSLAMAGADDLTGVTGGDSISSSAFIRSATFSHSKDIFFLLKKKRKKSSGRLKGRAGRRCRAGVVTGVVTGGRARQRGDDEFLFEKGKKKMKGKSLSNSQL